MEDEIDALLIPTSKKSNNTTIEPTSTKISKPTTLSRPATESEPMPEPSTSQTNTVEQTKKILTKNNRYEEPPKIGYKRKMDYIDLTL